MTLPANIRINVGAPFPSKVKGSGPVTITKQNGIWTVGFEVANLGALPLGVDPKSVLLLVYNGISNSFQSATVAALLSAGGLSSTAVNAAKSPYAVLPADLLLLVDSTAGPVEIDLAASAARSGLTLVIKDVGGAAAANNITIKPQGAPLNETIDNYTNAAPLVINANRDGVRLTPIPGGYFISP